MADAFYGEIRALAYSWAPMDWAQCNGQTVPLQQNQALYAVIGNIYGGTFPQTVGLPNLCSRVPMHWGNNAATVPQANAVNVSLGAPTVMLSPGQLPSHTHQVSGASAPGSVALTATPAATSLLFRPISGTVGFTAWSTAVPPQPQELNAQAITAAGAMAIQPHENRQPYLVVNFCICLYGVFPMRS